MDLSKQFKYERSIQPGKALFYKTDESEFTPLQVDSKTIRGQKSSYSEGYTRLSNKMQHHKISLIQIQSRWKAFQFHR